MRHYKEVSLSNDAGLMIDLHWRLVGNSHLLKGIKPFENSRSIPLGDTGDIRVLGQADEFAYLCSHGAMSDWARLKWLADINCLIADWSDERLVHNFQHAQSINAGRCVLQALALRSVFWGHPIPDALEHELEKVFSDVLIMHPLQCMTAPHKSASLGNTIARMRQQVRSRAMLYGSKAKALAEWRIYVGSLPDILAVPLPAALDWLYAPLHPLTWTLRKLRKR